MGMRVPYRGVSIIRAKGGYSANVGCGFIVKGRTLSSIKKKIDYVKDDPYAISSAIANRAFLAEPLTTGLRAAGSRLTNPISRHLAERPRRMYRSVMSTKTEVIIGAAVVAAGLGTLWYVRKKNTASSTTPTGPAPAQLTVTLHEGVNTVRVNGALTMNLPSGATWQSALLNGVDVTTPVGFSLPVTVPIATPSTFSVVYVDSSGKQNNATINASTA